MFVSHKRTLAIVLTVVTLLAMLTPAALAAPENVTKITITDPTAANWMGVNPEVAGANITVDYTIDVSGIQVDNVLIRATVQQKYLPDWGNVISDVWELKPANEFSPGANKFSVDIPWDDATLGFEILDGWYDVQVCMWQVDMGNPILCAEKQVSAVLSQDSYPWVDLEKPGVEPEFPGPDMFYWQHATVVTGQDYLMVGYANDDWNNIVDVEFQYCDESNFPFCFWRESPSWITVASLKNPDPATFVAPVTRYDNTHQFQATWDSSKVPDDFGWVRICVWNAVGLTNCKVGPDPEDVTRVDAHRVFVNNTSVIHLEPGWNLISTPIMPYKVGNHAAGAITDVLAGLIANKSVRDVWSFVWNGSQMVWQSWTAPVAGQGPVPSDLTTIEWGKGYWIFMNMEDDLVVSGTWKVVGNNAIPEIPVFSGSNLIGYTHFGRPTVWPSKMRWDYLGPDVEPYTRVLYRWDAENETYHAVYPDEWLLQGKGYWLSTIQDGVIAP